MSRRSLLGTSSRNEAVAWQVQSGLSWSGWARRRRAFVRRRPRRVQLPHGRAAVSKIHAMQDEIYNAAPSWPTSPLLFTDAVDFFMMGAHLCCTSFMVQSDSHQDFDERHMRLKQARNSTSESSIWPQRRHCAVSLASFDR